MHKSPQKDLRESLARRNSGVEVRHSQNKEVSGFSRQTKAPRSRAQASTLALKRKSRFSVSTWAFCRGLRPSRPHGMSPERSGGHLFRGRVRRGQRPSASTVSSPTRRPNVNHRRPKVLKNPKSELLSCGGRKLANKRLVFMAARSHTAVDRQGMPACPTEPRNQRTIPGEDLSNGRHDARSRVSAVQDTRGLGLGFCKSQGLGQLNSKLLRSSWSEEFA